VVKEGIKFRAVLYLTKVVIYSVDCGVCLVLVLKANPKLKF
jgi:hypothetical protein